MNKQQTLVSTVMRADDYANMSRKILSSLRRRLRLRAEVIGEFKFSLQLPLSDDPNPAYVLEAKVLTNDRGLPYLRLEIVGCTDALEGGQPPTWIIEQRGSGNILYADLQRPKFWPNQQLTLDEDVRPEGVPFNNVHLMLLNHLVESAHFTRRSQN